MIKALGYLLIVGPSIALSVLFGLFVGAIQGPWSGAWKGIVFYLMLCGFMIMRDWGKEIINSRPEEKRDV